MPAASSRSARCGASSPCRRIPTRRPCWRRSRASASAQARLTAIAGQPPDLATLPRGLRVRAALPARARSLRHGSAARDGRGPRAYDPLLAQCPGLSPCPAMAAAAARGGGTHQALQRAPRAARPVHRSGPRGGFDLVRYRSGHHAGAGRRVGLRQDDDVEAHPAARAPDRRRDPFRRPRRARARPRGPAQTTGAPCRPCSRIPSPRSTRACAWPPSSPSRW